jgi:hypothetical protein
VELEAKSSSFAIDFLEAIEPLHKSVLKESVLKGLGFKAEPLKVAKNAGLSPLRATEYYVLGSLTR